MEAEVTHGERSTKTSPVPTNDQSTSVLIILAPVSMSDQATQVISRPHQVTFHTQTHSPAPRSEQGTQALLLPRRSVAFTQTARPPKSTTTS